MSALTAVGQTAQAAALFQINNGVTTPTFNYGTNLVDNNVVNYAPSNIVDGSLAQTTSSTNWKGTGIGGPAAYVSIVGLDPSQTWTVQFTYLGSESGDTIRWSSTATATTFDETDKNNNVGGTTQVSHPLYATIGGTNNGTEQVPNFNLRDVSQAGSNSATNGSGGPNGPPGGGIANMIFSYANLVGGNYVLSSLPTNFVVFGFNDNGSPDDDHDDFMGVMILVPGGTINGLPIPGALPLFLGGLAALGLTGWRRKRNNAAGAA